MFYQSLCFSNLKEINLRKLGYKHNLGVGIIIILFIFFYYQLFHKKLHFSDQQHIRNKNNEKQQQQNKNVNSNSQHTQYNVTKSVKNVNCNC